MPTTPKPLSKSEKQREKRNQPTKQSDNQSPQGQTSGSQSNKLRPGTLTGRNSRAAQQSQSNLNISQLTETSPFAG